MRKVFATLTLVLVINTTQASTNPGKEHPVIDAHQLMIPIGDSGYRISLMDLAYIQLKDFEALSSKKLGLFKRIQFKIAQQKLRSNLNANGTLKKDALNKVARMLTREDGGFHLGGFALGWFLGPVGLLIAYSIKDDKKSARVKSAWISFLIVWVAMGLIILLILLELKGKG